MRMTTLASLTISPVAAVSIVVTSTGQSVAATAPERVAPDLADR